MKIGYIRASKKDDVFYEEQYRALEKEECRRIFEDIGEQFNGFVSMIDYIRDEEDRIFVQQLDRFGLNIRALTDFINGVLKRGVHLTSINDNIDTSTTDGLLLLKIFDILETCEQNALCVSSISPQNQKSEIKTQNVSNGSCGVVGNNAISNPAYKYGEVHPFRNYVRNDVVRDLGRSAGRPKGLSPQAKEKAEAAAALYQEGTLSMREIATNLNISTATLYSYLRYEKVI